MGISVAKIYIEKTKETKENIVRQNASICTRMKLKSIFWFFVLKKDRRIMSPIIEMDNEKMANMLIKEGLVLDHTLHKCISYNPACNIK